MEFADDMEQAIQQESAVDQEETPAPIETSTDAPPPPATEPELPALSSRPTTPVPTSDLPQRSSSPPPPPPPSGDAPSLSLTIYTAWNETSWARRIPAIVASVAINFGLPFINGVMLGTSPLSLLRSCSRSLTCTETGFGELFARNWIGAKLGWGTPLAPPGTSGGRASTTGVGLRAAGANEGQAGERRSAGERTAAEGIATEAEVLAGLVERA